MNALCWLPSEDTVYMKKHFLFDLLNNLWHSDNTGLIKETEFFLVFFLSYCVCVWLCLSGLSPPSHWRWWWLYACGGESMRRIHLGPFCVWMCGRGYVWDQRRLSNVYSVISGWTCLIGVGRLALTCTGMRTNSAQTWEEGDNPEQSSRLKPKAYSEKRMIKHCWNIKEGAPEGRKSCFFGRWKREEHFRMWDNPEAIVLWCAWWLKDSNVPLQAFGFSRCRCASLFYITCVSPR